MLALANSGSANLVDLSCHGVGKTLVLAPAQSSNRHMKTVYCRSKKHAARTSRMEGMLDIGCRQSDTLSLSLSDIIKAQGSLPSTPERAGEAVVFGEAVLLGT